ncbi:hypothetical protein BC829DRAFT_403406, partial [Chytridium lagenaria]
MAGCHCQLFGTLTAPTELTPLTLDDSAIFKWTLPSGWDHIQSSSHFPQYSILINCTLTTAPTPLSSCPKLKRRPRKSLTDYTAYGQLGSVKSWNFTPGTWNVNLYCRYCYWRSYKVLSVHYSSSKGLRERYRPTTYKKCRELLMLGKPGVREIPRVDREPDEPLKHKCIDANVAVADKCFAKVNPEGTATYTYDF